MNRVKTELFALLEWYDSLPEWAQVCYVICLVLGFISGWQFASLMFGRFN